MDVIVETLTDSLMIEGSEPEAVCRGYIDGKHTMIPSIARI